MSTSPDIFLSYNRDDQVTARQFAERFKQAGFTVWWDATLRSGEAYDEVTESALRTAKAVVVLWSPRSVVSRWVRAEATLADRNRTLVPAMIEACERPIMFELTQTAELGHWRGAADDKVWLAFLADVQGFVGRRTEPVAEAPEMTPVAAEKHVKGERGGAPAMAVLPFANRSGLPEDEAFAADLVEDLVDMVSQGVSVRVRAGSATTRFRSGAIADLAGVAEQLGVRYLLEGNVRRTAGKMRVTAQLVEAATGTILWTQRFERALAELDLLQDALVAEVATTLNTTVYHMEIGRALNAGDDMTAWQAAQRCMDCGRDISPERAAVALREGQRAVSIDHEYGLAHAVLAMGYAWSKEYGAGDDPRMRLHAERAIELSPSDAQTLTFAGFAITMLGEDHKGLQLLNRALRISPGNFAANMLCGLVLVRLHRWDEAIDYLETELRIARDNQANYFVFSWLALANAGAGRWDEARRQVDRALVFYPDFDLALLFRGLLLGREGKRSDAIACFARLRPSVRALGKDWAVGIVRWFFGNHAVSEELVANLNELWDGVARPA